MTFSQALTGVQPAQPILPVSHTTSLGTFKSIFASGTILTNGFCPLNGTKGCKGYFFYGGPYYVLKNQNGTIQIEETLSRPIGLIFRPEAFAGKEHDIYPFDTGAFLQNRYAPFSPPDVQVAQYHLPSQGLERAAATVRLMFGDNKTYMAGNYKAHAGNHTDPYAAKLRDMYGKAVSSDHRRHRIEVLADYQVSINDLLGVVVPDEYYTRECGSVLGSGLKFAVLKYVTMCDFDPDRDSAVMLAKATEFLREQKYF